MIRIVAAAPGNVSGSGGCLPACGGGVWEGVAHPPAAIPLDREAGMSPLVLRTKAVPAIQPAHEHQRRRSGCPGAPPATANDTVSSSVAARPAGAARALSRELPADEQSRTANPGPPRRRWRPPSVNSVRRIGGARARHAGSRRSAARRASATRVRASNVRSEFSSRQTIVKPTTLICASARREHAIPTGDPAALDRLAESTE